VENSHRYFKNHACKYFPCHTEPSDGEFNCLFCYCPLYPTDECSGNFSHTAKGIKMCMDCHLPHIPDYYDVIIEKLMNPPPVK